MLNLNLSAFQSHEFIVGIAVAAILVSALVASSLFRNVALALAAGAVVLLYLQGGVAALIATSHGAREGNPGDAGFFQRPDGRSRGFRRAAGRPAEARGLTSQALASSSAAPADNAGAFFSSVTR